MDQYNFSPTEVMSKIKLEEYILFVTYSLEYRTLVLEQMSEEREQRFLTSLSPDDRAKHERIPEEGEAGDELPPHGVLIHTFVIRDLLGVGWDHLGKEGQRIIKAVIAVGSDNYPEMLRKCIMINTPWVFNTIWFFVKGLIAQRTLDKISVLGSSFEKELFAEIGQKSVPAIIGGPCTAYVEYAGYPFNRSLFIPSTTASTVCTLPPTLTVFTTKATGSKLDNHLPKANDTKTLNTNTDTIEPSTTSSGTASPIDPESPSLSPIELVS